MNIYVNGLFVGCSESPPADESPMEIHFYP